MKRKCFAFKIEIFIFFENFIIFQHFGEESRQLITKVWSSTDADTHTKSNFKMI